MSRSCHRATSSSPAMRLPRRMRARPAQALGGDGVALVGHGRRALLAGRKPSSHLAHLGALQVAQLDGDQLDRGPDRRAGPQVLGVPVAGDDLRGRHRRQAECGAHVALHEGIDVGVRADRSGELADRHRLPGRAQAGSIAVGLQAPQGHLRPERRRLGVDAVGAPDHGGVAVAQRRRLERGDQRVGGGEEQLRGVAEHPAPARCPRRRTR